MSKTFFEMMDGVLEDYAQARLKQIPGVDMGHYYTTLKAELAMNVQKWFIKHVEAIAGNEAEIKTVILESNARSASRTGVQVPKNKESLL